MKFFSFDVNEKQLVPQKAILHPEYMCVSVKKFEE